MAQCWKCGRKGLFLKTRYDGLCKYCVEDENREKNKEQQKLERQIEQQNRINKLKQQEYQKHNKKIEQFRLEFPIKEKTDSPVSFLQAWKHIDFDCDEQIKRQKRAIHQTVPISINTKLCEGIFASHLCNKLYNTDFLSCSCPDYVERELPCKHMYRLFYEINTFTTNDGITNISYDTLDKFENLNAKEEFLQYCRWYRPNGTNRYCNDGLKELISIGFLQKNAPTDYTTVLNKLTKDEIILALAKKSITGYKPSWSKVKLVAWICETQPTFLEKKFSDYGLITVSPQYEKWIKGINESFNSYDVAYNYWS